MTLAEPTGLRRLLGEKVHIGAPRIKSASANPAPKLVTVVAGMCAGPDCIDDIDVVRSGGMKALFDGVYAPSTIGKLLREFTFGYARQLESVLSAAAMCCYGKQARKFLSWLPGPVDSAVRQSDSTQVTSFMVSYCQDRNISSATVVLHRGRLGYAHQPCREPWALSNRNLCGVSQFVQGSPAHPGFSSAVQMLHRGMSARAAVNSVDVAAQYRTSDQGGQPIRYRPPASLPQVYPGQSDRRSDAQ
jgi:hypothetical protein